MIPFPFIVVGGALGAYFLLRKKSPSSGGGGKSAYCASISFPNPASAADTQIIIAWMQSIAPADDALARFLELMRKLRPQCRWDEGTTTTIQRPGAAGPQSIPFQQIVKALRGHTIAEADAIMAAQLGMQSATPGVSPDGLRKLMGVSP